MGTAAPAIGASEAFQGNSKFSGRDENSNNITFGPALDQGRLQHPGLLGQMVDVPSDRLALPKVATHPLPHASRTIGAPRSEERRRGIACVSKFRSRCSTVHSKNTAHKSL